MGDEEFIRLLEASSLGAPHVKAVAGGIPPEEAERLRRALRLKELGRLLAVEDPSGEQLLWIAENAELLFDTGAARVWWERAAAAGNEDAIDVLQLLDDDPIE